MQAQFTLNQSRAEEITMREDYGCQLPPLNHDEEGFGDLGFGDSGPLEMIRDGSSIDHSLEPVLANDIFYMYLSYPNEKCLCREVFSPKFVTAVNLVGIVRHHQFGYDLKQTHLLGMMVLVGTLEMMKLVFP
jgi:hypothetical protein